VTALPPLPAKPMTFTPERLLAAALSAELHRLSAGRVRRIAASGPVLAPAPGPRPRAGTFIPSLSRRDWFLVAALSMGWLGCLAASWAWWVQPGHLLGLLGTAVNTAVLCYVSVLPAIFVAAVNRMRRVSPRLAVPELRTAFVVTKAPSEPWQVARTTLNAMLRQDFPFRYDVWLCDERPTPQTRAWCAAHGVRVVTRAGVPGYHRTTWPRRTRCKEVNLAYFYDRHGYRDYQVVAQLDCDHVPQPGYLREIVRPFADPAIGYVAAPSVCDSNAAESWAARGRLFKEAPFHGPLQLGHSDGLAPVCIGSHYAVRTRALRDIGGIGPELAEDFTTTFLLNAAGWHGAFAIDA
jgi:cellulose synthase (UDP-forming)